MSNGQGSSQTKDKNDFYRMPTSRVLKELGSGEKGLSREEADRIRARTGPNEIVADVSVPKWMLFLKQFRDLLVIILIIAGGISIAIGSYRDGGVMFAIVIINAIIGFVQEYKAGKILERLREMIKSPAKVMVNGELTEMSQRLLVPGDIVEVEAGDKIPADMRLLECFDFRTVEFSLTGESMPQEKTTNAIPEKCIISDQENMAFMGTTVATGNALGVVVRTGMDSEMGKIATMTRDTTEDRSPLQKELSNLAKWLTTIVVIISAILFGVAMWQGFSLFTGMILALGIAVAMVPQALPAQVTVALTAASKRLAQRKAVVKNLPSVETLGSTTVICTDKTGTLTKNEMTVTNVWFNNREYSMTGVGYEPEGEILDPEGTPLSQERIAEIEIMMDAATMASNAEIHAPDEEHSSWYPVGDPTEAALITMSTKLGTRSPREDEENPELHEFPFSSERKRMSSVRQFGDRVQLAMKGSTDSVLSVAKYIYRDGKPVPLTDEDRSRIRAMNELYSDKALRVLAIAFRPLDSKGRDYVMEEVERDVVFLGLVGMMDPPKDGVREAVSACRDAKVRIVIMTGDHAITARAVGREIGLSGEGDPTVYTGAELEEMDDPELTDILKRQDSVIFSRVSPEHKLRIVNILEDEKEVVAVTGDGVNDAPALKRADIGVAMGITGTDVAKEAAELILLDDSFPTLVEAVREGRTIYRNLKKTVLASITTNMAELMVVVLGLAAVAMDNWAIPILALQILAIDLLAEVMPLTCLTFDPPPPGIMRSSPRDRAEHIMNRQTSPEVLLLGALIGGLAFANYALGMFRYVNTPFLSGLTVPYPAAYMKATTLAYLTIAFCQFANIMSRRFRLTSIFNRNTFSNKVILWSIAGSITMILVAIYVPFVSKFLYFSGPGLTDWIYVIGSALVFLGVFELMKAFKRRKARNGKS
ncbi:MAG: HAD-IC family P-type ATPase [Candidatus Aegiribacteria sp.]|nr:HAD-IC family P-type ATPase [Candidatus Aegiribacteria sp.]MBD3295716.1 HAD-IC family P-type ATPase [Candidatus Fermentibacteria bacterium]